jgi:hypothetical protein
MLITLIVFLLIVSGTIWFKHAKTCAPELIVGDDTWDGTFPCCAPEFKGPAYVYADGMESPNIRFDVPIIGYRVASDLIVSVDFGYDVSSSEAVSYAKQKHAELPSVDNLKRLIEKWDDINALRKAVEDFVLPEIFWVMLDDKPEMYCKRTQSFLVADRRLLEEQTTEAILIIKW